MSAATQNKPSAAKPLQPVIPHLVVEGGKQAVSFYERAFGAKAEIAAETPDGKLLHCSLELPNGGLVYLMDARAPIAAATSRVIIHLDVADVDETFERAVAAGAKVEMPLEDQFWGDRYGSVVDPFGHTWSMATRVRDVSAEELQRALKHS